MTNQHVGSYKSFTVPALSDNYIHFITHIDGQAIIIDPAEAKPAIDIIKEHNLTPIAIFNTHHHNDHIGGNDRLVSQYNIPVYGPPKRIRHVTNPVHGGESLQLLDLNIDVIATPGHTTDHVSFHFHNPYGLSWLCCGDALFYLGVGRMFEGNGTEMWDYLQKLRALDDNTLVFCGHEYSQKNADFTFEYGINTQSIQGTTLSRIKKYTNMKQPTIPYRLKNDKATNLFLNCDNQNLKDHLDMRDKSDSDVFIHLRTLRDNF